MANAPFDPEATEAQGQEANQEAPLAAQDSPAERTRKIKAAMAWLRDYLHGQPTQARLIEAEASRLGIAHTTLQTAKERLYISSVRQGKGWVWLPAHSRKKQPVTK